MHQALSRRERQIMDVLYREGRATAADVQAALPGSPSDSTVRTQLRVLEAKGHVVHETQGNRFVYAPTVPRHSARRSALRHLVDTFFDGSRAKVVAALLGTDTVKLTPEELEGIDALLRRAREEAP
jgi:predicted transcriptional regulator